MEKESKLNTAKCCPQSGLPCCCDRRGLVGGCGEPLPQREETLAEWAARIDAMPENPDSLAVLDRINRTGSALPSDEEVAAKLAKLREGEAYEERQKYYGMIHPEPRACRCGVAGCDPSGVPECSKGIRERRALP